MGNSLGKSLPSLRTCLAALSGAAILSGFCATSLYNYLLFHTLVELTSVIIACAVFMFFWNSRRFLDSGFLLLVGISCLFSGILNLMHVLTYKGFLVFPGWEAGHSIQFKTAAQWMASLTFLVAPLFLRRRIKAIPTLLGYSLVLALVFYAVFTNLFPDFYIPGAGMTFFQHVSRGLSGGAFLAAGVLLAIRSRELDPGVFRILLASLVLASASEFASAVAKDYYGVLKIAAHLFEVVSLYFLYEAFLGVGLTKPYDLIFRNLRLSEETVKSQQQALQVVLDTMTKASRQEITNLALEAAVSVTGSKIGYLAFMNQDESVLTMHSWSKTAMQECAIIDKPIVYPVASTGLWGEAVRQRKPVITNDYEADNPLKKGCPQGHVRVLRHMNAPIFEGERIVIVAGVGNKKEPYDKSDVRQLTLLMQGMWQLLERRRMEEALRQSEERFRMLVENVTDYAVYMLDPQGRVASWNVGAQRIKGYCAEEIIGRDFSVFYTCEDIAAGKPAAHLRTAEQTGRVEEEGRRVRKGGSRFWASAVITAVRDETNRLRGFAKVTRDITERRRAEETLRHHATQLEVANRELETFSYSVSHDLRTPLRSLDGFSAALIDDYGDKLDEQAKDYLNRIRAASQRMGALIDDLLELSRISRQELVRTPVDLSGLVRAINRELQSLQPSRNVELLVEDGLTAEGDERLLRAALQQLLENAWKFTGRQRSARIEFGRIESDGDQVYFVRDNGVGFDMNYADKLFGAFQRLHGTNDFPGLGIGLATVQRIVRRHGGRIWADSAPGKGATFFFTV